MSQEDLIEKLAKANRDVKKLCEFFAERRSWSLAHDAGESALDLATAASKIDDHLQGLIWKGRSTPPAPAQPDVDLLPEGTLDHARLARFTIFLRDLDLWITAQNLATSSPSALSELKEMQTRLACITEVVRAVATIPEPPTESAPATDDAGQPSTPETSPEPIEQFTPEGVPLQLVLDDTDETPMTQKFRGLDELTSGCTKAVDDFIAAWGLEFSYVKRKKLLERVLRWITSAPEGHVLVMKMKTAEEPFEPYPSYVSRDVLAGNLPEPDPFS